MSETIEATGLSCEPPAGAGTGKDGARDNSDGDPVPRKHFVHVYTVVRVKVEVEAEDHQSAMAAADTLLLGNGFAVSLIPRGKGVIEADYAEEVVGYLVDEADDPEYERSRNYGPDHQPQDTDHRYRPAPAVSSEGRSITLNFLPQAWWNDHAIEVDPSGPTDWTIPLSVILQRFPSEVDWHAKAEDRDDLRHEGDAPQWIRDWSGPFEVRLDEEPDDVWSRSDGL